MSVNNLVWQLCSREELSDCLFGNRPLNRIFLDAPDNTFLGLDAIAVAFDEDRRNRSYSPPAMILLNDNSHPEVLSWLRVNSPEIFPLSQYARVLSWPDWVAFYEHEFYKSDTEEYGREDRWASIIAGEIVAQGDAGADLSKLSLSRAAGCFSTAVARARLTYGAKQASAICVQRLKTLELDQRFVRRHVAVKELEPIWAIAEVAGLQTFERDEAIDLVFYALRRDDRSASLLNLFSSAHNLYSDSIEERVVAFNALIDALKVLPAKIRTSSPSSSVLAVAAFLVGNSTSHEFLVRRNLEAFPYGPIWFGLLAGLLGPAHWDAAWARTAKGVERQLRSKFRWEESAGFDLCWAEYAWYAATFDDSTFSDIPKLVQRVLSVEVVPGASCQLRMSGGQSAATAVSQQGPQSVDAAASTPKEMLDVFNQLIRLAAKAEKFTLNEQHQVDFFDRTSAPSRNRSRRPKGSP